MSGKQVLGWNNDSQSMYLMSYLIARIGIISLSVMGKNWLRHMKSTLMLELRCDLKRNLILVRRWKCWRKTNQLSLRYR